MALLVQPTCILYTRSVMQAAAAQTCRLVSTTPEAQVGFWNQREFALRRLASVPDVPIFCTGDWEVEIEGSGSSHEVRVKIATAVRPLPFMGVLPALLGGCDAAGNVVLEVEVATTPKPDWVEGGYGDWTSIWD